jgi:hypothetical protein
MSTARPAVTSANHRRAKKGPDAHGDQRGDQVTPSADPVAEVAEDDGV